MTLSEADWEAIALDRLAEHGWQHVEARAIAPGTEGGRTSCSDLFCRGRLLAAVHRLNPQVPWNTGSRLSPISSRHSRPTRSPRTSGCIRSWSAVSAA